MENASSLLSSPGEITYTFIRKGRNPRRVLLSIQRSTCMAATSIYHPHSAVRLSSHFVSTFMNMSNLLALYLEALIQAEFCTRFANRWLLRSTRCHKIVKKWDILPFLCAHCISRTCQEKPVVFSSHFNYCLLKLRASRC